MACRRSFLGTAAPGASGLVTLAGMSQARADDKGQPGQGGFGRDVTQLPPGARVAYHDLKNVAELPAFVRSLDGSKPKVTSGGWAEESTEHQMPLMKGLAGVHMNFGGPPDATRKAIQQT